MMVKNKSLNTFQNSFISQIHIMSNCPVLCSKVLFQFQVKIFITKN